MGEESATRAWVVAAACFLGPAAITYFLLSELPDSWGPWFLLLLTAIPVGAVLAPLATRSFWISMAFAVLIAVGAGVGAAIRHPEEPDVGPGVFAITFVVVGSLACIAGLVRKLSGTRKRPSVPDLRNCLACGYSLQNLAGSQLCPECGRPMTYRQFRELHGGRFVPAGPQPSPSPEHPYETP